MEDKMYRLNMVMETVVMNIPHVMDPSFPIDED
jgi:hypothetical protein